MIENYDLNKICPVYQLHDERIHDIVMKDESIELVFEKLIRPREGFEQCTIIFDGFEDIEYGEYDVSLLVFEMDKYLGIKGKKYYLADFYKTQYERPFMEVIKIYTGYKTVIFEGVLLNEKCRTKCFLRVEAQNMSYHWK